MLHFIKNETSFDVFDDTHSVNTTYPLGVILEQNNDVLEISIVGTDTKLFLKTYEIGSINNVPFSGNISQLYDSLKTVFSKVPPLSPEDVGTLITEQIDVLKDGVSTNNDTLRKLETNLPITNMFISTLNQTIFVIDENMQYTDKTEMYINGVFQRYGSDFTVDTDPKQIKYTNTQYALQLGDDVVIKHFKQYI